MADPADDQRQDYDDRFGTESPAGVAPTARPSPARRGIELGIVIGVAVVGFLWLANSMPSVRPAALRMKSSNNLKQIGLALHNYHDEYGEFPNNTYGLDGRPLLSWRVHILPYIEQETLFKQFNLDEPWDSANNLRLLQQIPPVYAPPTGRRGGLTNYRGFSSRGAVFEPRANDYRPRYVFIAGLPFGIESVKDGLSNTIFVVEAGELVEWTKPVDLDASPGLPFPELGGVYSKKGEFQAAMGDGSVRLFRKDFDEDRLRALITHSGGEVVSPD